MKRVLEKDESVALSELLAKSEEKVGHLLYASRRVLNFLAQVVDREDAYVGQYAVDLVERVLDPSSVFEKNVPLRVVRHGKNGRHRFVDVNALLLSSRKIGRNCRLFVGCLFAGSLGACDARHVVKLVSQIERLRVVGNTLIKGMLTG